MSRRDRGRSTISSSGATKRFDVAVVGCGAISHEHLAYLSASPAVRLVAVCDTSEATALFAHRRFGGERWFTDVNEMLVEARPEVVHVLTPPQTHKSLIELCLRADAHVICEKPMTGSAAETASLLGLAKDRGRLLVETRNMLFNDVVRTVDDLIGRGQLGAVKEVDVLLSLDLTAGPFGDLNLLGPGVALPGGAVHDFLPHLAYLFLHFAGHAAPVDDVVGCIANFSGNARVGFDHMDALVRAGDCRGRLRIASDVAPDVFRLTVRGSAGTVETDFYNPFMRFQGTANSGKRAPIEQVVSGLQLAGAGFLNLRDKVLQHGTYHGLPRMLDAIYQGLQAGEAPAVREDDVIATAMLVDRLVQLRGGT